MSTRRQIAESKARELRRHVRKTYSIEEKLRIVLLGLKGDVNITELCQKEGISMNLYQIWSKEFLEGGRSRLAGESFKDEATGEIKSLKNENKELKLLVAELILQVRGLQQISD